MAIEVKQMTVKSQVNDHNRQVQPEAAKADGCDLGAEQAKLSQEYQRLFSQVNGPIRER